MYNKSTSNRS